MAMVVKNNMSAISTLNTLNKNSSALAKSLQKVSSGMKINGAADEYAPGTYRYAFEEAPVVVNKTLKLSIRTDDEPQNITWDIVKTSNGEVVVSGGPYEEPHKVYSENIELVDDNCYMFTIYDAGGNGMAGGNGLYGIKVGSQTIISGNDFTDTDRQHHQGDGQFNRIGISQHKGNNQRV